MICFHKYKLIFDKMVTIDVKSHILNKEWEEDCLLKIYQCEKCKKMKGMEYYNFGKQKVGELDLYKIKNALKV